MSIKRRLFKDFLWALVFFGGVAIVFRFALGLGYTTGLNDASPWGLWIALKLAFVALSGGGFTLAAMVYIFHLEDYRPIIRRALLMALLGYGSFIVSLIFDLGLPWRIYMPIIRWQHHSVMFEIAWCVMLYFTVLNLEFGPVIAEHPWLQHPIIQWISRMLHRLIIPVVIAGIVLSTLHQSSLGALFLAMPFRVHPLWYSPLIPVFFFLSAIGLGLMAVILDGYLAAWLFDQQLHRKFLAQLGKIAAYVLWLYVILRLGDLLWRGIIPTALDGSWQSFMFLGEIIIGTMLPATLLLIPRIRRLDEGLITCSILTVYGVVSQRMSLSLLTMRLPEGTSYFPSLLETAIALAVPAAAGLIYFLFAENLALLQEELPDSRPSPYARPQFDPTYRIHRADTLKDSFIRRSGLAVVVAALAVALLPTHIVSGQPLPQNPVKPVRGWESMTINGDRDETKVTFEHEEHIERRLEIAQGDKEQACADCHHLNRPEDEATACAECHRDMSLATSIFDHTWHQQELGGNDSCTECHQGQHTAENTHPCSECHDTMQTNRDGSTPFTHLAPGYEDAMHNTCIACHKAEVAEEKPELTQCPACHTFTPTEQAAAQAP